MRFVRPTEQSSGKVEAHTIWCYEFSNALDQHGIIVGDCHGRERADQAQSLMFGAGPLKQPAKGLSFYSNFAVELRGGGQTRYGVIAGVLYAWQITWIRNIPVCILI